MKHSIVAMFGWIIPAPLAIPPTVTVCPSISTCTARSLVCVSVVMMARARSCPPSSERRIVGKCSRMMPIGSSTPMTPVLQMSISSGLTPRPAAASAVTSRASISPCSPTLQFAQPLLATMPLARPPAFTVLRLKVTDGDTMEFCENVPATVQGESESSRPRSSLPGPGDFSPANVAPAENPLGLVIVPPSMVFGTEVMWASRNKGPPSLSIRRPGQRTRLDEPFHRSLAWRNGQRSIT